mmetsp:Transcript_18226/g.27452  ORF Transcript_18226/g.27452 Transcript_18226/m.27452 type:complete len:214 (+) Transcript_18226:1321-1962(+)
MGAFTIVFLQKCEITLVAFLHRILLRFHYLLLPRPLRLQLLLLLLHKNQSTLKHLLLIALEHPNRILRLAPKEEEEIPVSLGSPRVYLLVWLSSLPASSSFAVVKVKSDDLTIQIQLPALEREQVMIQPLRACFRHLLLKGRMSNPTTWNGDKTNRVMIVAQCNHTARTAHQEVTAAVTTRLQALVPGVGDQHQFPLVLHRVMILIPMILVCP